jgi:hypothetical protein
MRSLGRVDTCQSQLVRVDYMCPKMSARGRRGILVGGSLGHPRRADMRQLVANQTQPIVQQSAGWPPATPPFPIFLFFGIMGKFGDGPSI